MLSGSFTARSAGTSRSAGIATQRSDKRDAVADFEVGDAGANRHDLAGAFVARNEWHADRRRIHAHAEIGIDEIDAAGMLLDLDLALAWRGDLDIFVGEDFGTTGFVNAHCRDHFYTPWIDLLCRKEFGPR